jgi:hypothetical protein
MYSAVDCNSAIPRVEQMGQMPSALHINITKYGIFLVHLPAFEGSKIIY